MINTRDYFGRPLYLAGTPTPYQGFDPIGSFQPRSMKSPSADLRAMFEQQAAAPTGPGTGPGAGPGTGPGVGAQPGTGTTGTGTQGTNGTGAAPALPPVFPTPAPVVPGGQPAQGGPSAMDIALGVYRYGQRPNGQPTDNPYGYPDWETARRAYEWEIAHGGTVLDKSPGNPDQPDYERYPGTSGDQTGGSGTSGGSSGGSSSSGGGGNEQPLPPFGIGGGIDGNYPGVWTPSQPPQQNDPSIWEMIDGAWTLKDIFGSGGTTGIANDLVQGLVAGPGSVPPTTSGGGFGEFAGQVGDAIGVLNLGKTLLDGDADGFDKTMAAVSYAFPALGAAYLGMNLLGVGGGESSRNKEQRGYETWGAVNDAFLDALGRDEGASRNIGAYHPNLQATNVDDLNFINSFLQSKDLLWGEGEYRPGGVKGGELIDLYGDNGIEKLWGDLTGYYNTYGNAPKPGDVLGWGESADKRLDDYFASLASPTEAYNAVSAGNPLWDGYIGSPSAGLTELLTQSQGGPANNPLYNPYLNNDFLTEYTYGLALDPSDPWGINAANSGRESGGWSYGW